MDGELHVTKHAMYMQVPEELLMDMGIIADTRPPSPPPSLRTRLRWKRQAWRQAMAKRAYRLIAGYDPPDGD